MAWGQRPVVTVRVGPSTREAADSLRAVMYSPMRHDIANAWTPSYDESKRDTFAVDRPILYRSRDENKGGRERALAGRFTLAVSLDVSSSQELLGIDQPYENGIRMEGEPVDGPDWAPVNEPGPAPSESPLAGEAAQPTPAQAEDPEQIAMEEEGSMSATVWLALVASVALLAAVSAGLWALTRPSTRDSD